MCVCLHAFERGPYDGVEGVSVPHCTMTLRDDNHLVACMTYQFSNLLVEGSVDQFTSLVTTN